MGFRAPTYTGVTAEILNSVPPPLQVSSGMKTWWVVQRHSEMGQRLFLFSRKPCHQEEHTHTHTALRGEEASSC